MSTLKLQRRTGKQPVYLQISDALKRDIQRQYQAGDALPSEFELSSTYRVNRHTLRRAVDVLVQDGIVTRHQGKGVFVKTPRIEYPIASRTRLTETLEAQGHTAISRILDRRLITANKEVANFLGISKGDEVIFLEAIRLSDNIPFCLGTHYIPHALFPALLHEYTGGSLHDFIEQVYKVDLARHESMVSAVMPDSGDVELLNIPLQLPVLQVRSTNVVKESCQPAEYVITRFRGDLAEIVVQPYD